MSRDNPPHSDDDPEEALRQLLRESAVSDETVPRAKHKRYAKRAMRRRKESAHMLEVQSGRRDDTPLTPIRTYAAVSEDRPVKTADGSDASKERDLEVERLRSERRRLQDLVHKLRKEASDSKRQLQFTKTELETLEKREEQLRKENQRLQRAVLRSSPPLERQRLVSGVSSRKTDADDDDRTGT